MVCKLLKLYKCVNHSKYDLYWEGLNDGMDSFDDDDFPLFRNETPDQRPGTPTKMSKSKSISPRKRISESLYFRRKKIAHRYTKQMDYENLIGLHDVDSMDIDAWRPVANSDDTWTPFTDDDIPFMYDMKAPVQFLPEQEETYSI